MSPEQSNDFSVWERDFSHLKNEVIANDSVDSIIDLSIDPIDAAQRLTAYVNSHHPDAYDVLIRNCIYKMNYKFMGTYVTQLVVATVNKSIGEPGFNQLNDMADMLLELQNAHSVTVGGKMGPFEKHYFTRSDGITYPEISLRMYDSAFIRANSAGEPSRIAIPNYVTLPARCIDDYRINNYF